MRGSRMLGTSSTKSQVTTTEMTKQLSPSLPATTDTTPHGSPGGDEEEEEE